MTTKYLDSNGLLYLWQKIRNTFVSDVTWDSTNKKLVKKKKTGTSGAEVSTDLVTFATVATSGSYNDLSNKPSIPSATSTSPKMDGTAAVGSETKWAKGDHVHPSDTSRVPTTRKVNNKALSSDITLTGEDIDFGDSEHFEGNVHDVVELLYEGVQGQFESVSDLISGLDDDKVDKETGKGLSTNDYTTAEKNKLAGIASGAEVNVQSDWNQTTTTADDYIKNKPTIPSAGTGSSYPVMDGTRSLGSQAGFARVDHVHPTDTSRAPLASPEFTGTPKAPTATAGTNTTQIATTAFVKSAVDTAVSGAVAYQGIAPTSFAPTNYKAGWYWVIGTGGTYCGQICEAGDMIFCKTAASTYSASNFDVVQTNLDITSITNAEIDTILAA